MLARLTYALLGFLFGAMLALLLWWLFGLGFQPNAFRHPIEPNPSVWIKYVGGACAIGGFLFKDRVADLIGLGTQAALDIERGKSDFGDLYVPKWLAIVVLLSAACAAWYFGT